MELLDGSNLIELHRKLDEFANYHQDKGIRKSKEIVNQLIIEENSMVYSASSDLTISRSLGYKSGLNELSKRLDVESDSLVALLYEDVLLKTVKDASPIKK